MSHFFTVVLVRPTDGVDINTQVENLLAPFNEDLEVPAYDKDCYCIGRIAHNYGFDIASQKVGAIQSFRDKYWAMPEDQRPEWKEFIFEFEKINEEVAKAHPLYEKPNPECEECNGTGKYPSTYNPQSEWDWWDIGGRWNGEIRGDYRGDNSGGFNFGAEFRQIHENMIPLSEMKKPVIPFAILTPDGEWCEKGKMGWWGMVSGRKDENDWEASVKEIYAKYHDCIAVGCDLHI